MTKTGRCKLCDQSGKLLDGHYWSRMAYKRYVADQSHGGEFTNLQTRKRTTRQATAFLFCEECERKFAEGYAGTLLDRIEADPTLPQQYDHRLLRFVVSISWRGALYYMDRAKNQPARDLLRIPCKRWKDFLNSGIVILPHSQHVFIDYGESVPGTGTFWHNTIGGEPFFDERLLVSRIGPLIIVGLLDRKQLSSNDRKIWCRSEITVDGGEILPLKRRIEQGVLADDLVRVLDKQEEWCLKQREKVT